MLSGCQANCSRTHMPLSPSSIIWYQSRAAMSCDWEGYGRSGVALAMRHRLKWFIYLRAQGEMSTTSTLLMGMVFFLHFACDAKCIVVTRVCVSVCMCLRVCLSAAACLHYCTDPDVTWGSGRGRGCPLVAHYWADLQSVHGLRCYGNITRTRNVSECMLVLALCLVIISAHRSRT